MSTFLQRTISGSLFATAVVGSIILGRYSFLIVFLALTIGTLIEFYKFAYKARIRPQFLYALLLGAIIFIMNYLFAIGELGNYIFLGIIPLVISVFIIELFRNHNRPMHNIAFTLLGLVYVAFPFSMLNYFALSYSSYRIGYQIHILLGYFILIWANDSGAYAFGMSLGRNKLFPKVSPRKSWEGLVGGLFTTVLVAWIISLFFTNVSLFHWMAIGLISAVMSIFGDLVESMFKRSLDLKDSGKFLPGHGGLLDRFDGMLLSAPIVFVYLEIMMLI